MSLFPVFEEGPSSIVDWARAVYKKNPPNWYREDMEDLDFLFALINNH